MNSPLSALEGTLPEEPLRTAADQVTAGQLALELMHEIRNPLEALGNLSFLTYGDAHNPEKVRSYMKMAEEQLATLNQIVSQTLGVARSTSQPQLCNLVAVIEAALRIHQRAIERKEIHLAKELPSEDLYAEVHATEILQVLSNLLVNALDALPQGGSLHIRLRKGRDSIRFTIADSGRGIPAEDREKIFAPFFTSKGSHGNGLGLSISKKIIERHRGTICLRSSVRPGRTGTTFKVSLPATA